MSVSGLVPLDSSLDLRADQKLWKSWSLLYGWSVIAKRGKVFLVPTYIRCHTWLRCAGMRALSSTDVDVGIPEGIVMFKVCIFGRAGYWLTY